MTNRIRTLLVFLLAVCMTLCIAACAHEHSFETKWSSDENEHWHASVCGHADEVSDKGSHSLDSDYKCTVCGYQHVHSFAAEWSKGEEGHWHADMCGHNQKGSLEAHAYDANYVCTKCNYTHTHTYGDGLRRIDNDTHGYFANCGTGHPYKDVAPHEYKDCVCECGDIKHTYDYSHYVYDYANHWYAASCSHNDEHTSKQPHSFGNSIKCLDCGYYKTNTENLNFVLENGEYKVTGFKSSVDKSNRTVVSIPDMYMGKAVVAISDGAFDYEENLTVLVIPDSVKTVGKNAFKGCARLNTVVTGNGLETIGQSAFEGCYDLTSITLPQSLTAISSNAFEECYCLVEIKNASNLTVTKGASDNGGVARYALNIYGSAGESKLVKVEDFVCYSDDANGKLIIRYLGKNTSIDLFGSDLERLFIKDGTYKVNDYAFVNNNVITSISFTETLTAIGTRAFQFCGELKTVNCTKQSDASEGLTVGEGAFTGCTKLTYVGLAKKINGIGSGAFYNCKALLKINYGGTKNDWEAIRNRLTDRWENNSGITVIKCSDGECDL